MVEGRGRKEGSQAMEEVGRTTGREREEVREDIKKKKFKK